MPTKARVEKGKTPPLRTYSTHEKRTLSIVPRHIQKQSLPLPWNCRGCCWSIHRDNTATLKFISRECPLHFQIECIPTRES